MFDSVADLTEKIRLGEDSFLERKEVRFSGSRVSAPRRDSLADELAAFANSRGGVCVMGVADNREVVGIALDQLDCVEDFIRELCISAVTPPLSPVIEGLSLASNTGAMLPVIKIEVPGSLFVHRSPSGYLHRVGSAKREMAPDYLARLFQQRSQARIIRFDEQAVPGITLDDLPPELWQRFRSPRVTEILPDAGQHYQIDARDITGPLDQQVLEACHFVGRNMRVEAIKQMGRRDLPQFDLTAVFEAVVNAVAHRDYSIYGAKIRLRLFSDRLELYSPGAIPNTMTVESLPYRQAARNEAIPSLLAQCPIPADDQVLTDRNAMMDKRGKACGSSWTAANACPENTPTTG